MFRGASTLGPGAEASKEPLIEQGSARPVEPPNTDTKVKDTQAPPRLILITPHSTKTLLNAGTVSSRPDTQASEAQYREIERFLELWNIQNHI